MKERVELQKEIESLKSLCCPTYSDINSGILKGTVRPATKEEIAERTEEIFKRYTRRNKQ